jgi:MFS transporter, ACS family, pantothenate transporter
VADIWVCADDFNRTFFAWANDAMRYEDETFRGVVLASMNMMSNAVNAWWSIIFYGAVYAPYFTVSMLLYMILELADGLNREECGR